MLFSMQYFTHFLTKADNFNSLFSASVSHFSRSDILCFIPVTFIFLTRRSRISPAVRQISFAKGKFHPPKVDFIIKTGRATHALFSRYVVFKCAGVIFISSTVGNEISHLVAVTAFLYRFEYTYRKSVEALVCALPQTVEI